MLRAYQSWIKTGTPPTLNLLPIPANPDADTTKHWEMRYSDILTSIESGDPEQLRNWIIGDGSCGEWIPAQPGDTFGPTIEGVVLGNGQ